jgi:hypothetical protein
MASARARATSQAAAMVRKRGAGTPCARIGSARSLAPAARAHQLEGVRRLLPLRSDLRLSCCGAGSAADQPQHARRHIAGRHTPPVSGSAACARARHAAAPCLSTESQECTPNQANEPMKSAGASADARICCAEVAEHASRNTRSRLSRAARSCRPRAVTRAQQPLASSTHQSGGAFVEVGPHAEEDPVMLLCTHGVSAHASHAPASRRAAPRWPCQAEPEALAPPAHRLPAKRTRALRTIVMDALRAARRSARKKSMRCSSQMTDSWARPERR